MIHRSRQGMEIVRGLAYNMIHKTGTAGGQDGKKQVFFLFFFFFLGEARIILKLSIFFFFYFYFQP